MIASASRHQKVSVFIYSTICIIIVKRFICVCESRRGHNMKTIYFLWVTKSIFRCSLTVNILLRERLSQTQCTQRDTHTFITTSSLLCLGVYYIAHWYSSPHIVTIHTAIVVPSKHTVARCRCQITIAGKLQRVDRWSLLPPPTS